MSDSKDSRKATRGESSSYGTSAVGAPRRGAGGRRAWLGRFVRNRVAPIGLVIIAASLGVALGAPLLVPHDIRAMHPAEALRPPGGAYLFGTDEFGRDVLSRVLMGSRISLAVAFLSVLAPVTVQVSLSLSLAILSESALSFLGLGTQPPTPSWGNMLSEGRQFLELAPWNAVFPGLAIMLVVLGFNLLGDGLRDLLDPRLR